MKFPRITITYAFYTSNCELTQISPDIKFGTDIRKIVTSKFVSHNMPGEVTANNNNQGVCINNSALSQISSDNEFETVSSNNSKQKNLI